MNDEIIRKAPYFYENCDVLLRLIGSKIVSVYRVSDIETDDVLHDYEPIIIETDTDNQIFINVDEGMSNIMFIDNIGNKEAMKQILARYNEMLRIEIVNNYKSELLPDIDFTSPIKDINIISKEHEFSGWYEMSGIEIKFESGDVFIIGTALTDLHIQGIWILYKNELNYDWLRSDLPSSL